MTDTKTNVIEKNPALGDISVEELEELLNEKKAFANKQKKAKRESYELRRESMINDLCGFAVGLRGQMIDLKLESFMELAKFRLEMLAYGEIRGGENNKGSFEVKNDRYKIKFSSQVNTCFDERAELAETKLKQFLASFVKKNDKKAYTLIMTLMEKNSKTGDFDYDLINRLYKMKDQFQNPLWVEALEMFMESYSPYGTAQYIQFFVKNEGNNSWEAVVLDFAKLKSAKNEPTTKEA